MGKGTTLLNDTGPITSSTRTSPSTMEGLARNDICAEEKEGRISHIAF
jgi:hypothetical protein